MKKEIPVESEENVEIDKSVLSLSKFRNAIISCSKGVAWKESVQKFLLRPLTSSYDIINAIRNGKYKISNYAEFIIYDPKVRTILATRMKDRVFQRVMCDNGVYEDLTKSFIYDNGACQKEKGTDFTIRRISKFLNNYYLNNKSNKGYALHLDIAKYFPSTPHSVVKKVIDKFIKHPEYKKYLYEIVDSFKDNRPPEEIENDPFGERGIGLGSQLSQLFQLAVLSGLDHKIKEKLHIKYYVRYMDDILMIHESPEKLIDAKKYIIEYIEKYGLKLKDKFPIEKLEKGFTFMKIKFILKENGKVIRVPLKRFIYKERKRLKKLVKMADEGIISYRYIEVQHFNSWMATAKKFTPKKFIKDMKIFLNNLLPSYVSPFIFRINPKNKKKRKKKKFQFKKFPL